MSSAMLRSAQRGLGLAPRRCCRAPLRSTRVAATTPDDGASPSGTVFYGGQSFTESEWKEALASGKLARPAAPETNTTAVASTLSFNDVMGFSGTAPEIVNGRLAMLGFVAAIAAEFVSGEGVLKQWSEEPTGVAIAFLLFIGGSLVTAFQPRRDEKLGPFTPQAELLNGRAAMIGFAALLLIELVKGSPLI